MTAVSVKIENFYNPLDAVEAVMLDREWTFDRPDDGQLVAEAPGRWASYQIWFDWQEDAGGLALLCTLSGKFPQRLLPQVQALLAITNEKLWLGHFSVSAQDGSVSFRHAVLLPGDMELSAEYLSDLIDLAIEECERFFPAFQSVVWGGKKPDEALAFALFETVAEA